MRAWRLVDDIDSSARGAEQMARDVALMNSVGLGGAPAVRFYTWNPPALSLGRFQTEDDVDRDACARLGVDVVRRPTGGRALLHGGDLTYAIALARPDGPAGRVDSLYATLAEGLVAGLRNVGVAAAVAHHDGPDGPVCFAGAQGADLRVGNRKVCGSAQVRRGRTVLQHGAILLRRLAFDETDLLVGAPGRSRLRDATVTLEELDASIEPRVVATALMDGFQESFGIRLIPERAHRPRPLVAVERR